MGGDRDGRHKRLRGEFVAARSPRLLRVCYLLTRDRAHWAQAEDVLHRALAKVWLSWAGVAEPERTCGR